MRGIATGIDLLAMVILLVPALALGANERIVDVLRLPAVAVLQALLLVRFGSTVGGTLFEIEVVDARTGGRPSWREVLVRNLVIYGPMFVLDAARASYEVSSLDLAATTLTMTNIRTVVGSMDLDQLLAHRDEINERLLRVMDAAASPWGCAFRSAPSLRRPRARRPEPRSTPG